MHASSWQGVLYVTGGGSGLLSSLLTTPGASATVLEARVPYSAEALEGLIGAFQSSAGMATAGALAVRAFARARGLAAHTAGPKDQVFGLGLTAALETERARRGPNRAHVCVQTLLSTHRFTIHLAKGRGRRAEEALVARLALGFMHECLLGSGEYRPQLAQGDASDGAVGIADESLRDLLWGDANSLSLGTTGERPKAVLSGSFNPFHAGHEAMISFAEDRLGCPVALELCVANADKPPLDYVEINRRVEALIDKGDLWLTRLPLFAQKAEAFGEVTFLVGADTLIRIAEVTYYGDESDREDRFRRFAELGVRFLVFARKFGGGIQALEALDLPPSLRVLCDGVGEDEFRVDLSSSEVRGETQG